MASAALVPSVKHEHNPDECEDCQMEAKQDYDMGLAMTSFAIFGIILFAMWYMLRTCKKVKDEEYDPSNPQSRGRYRPATYSNDDDVP